MKINITGLDRAEVLLALCNNAMYKGPKFSSKPELKLSERPLATLEDAQQNIERRNLIGDYSFDFVVLGSSAKILDVDLSGSEFDSSEYDNHHGLVLQKKLFLI